MKKILGILREQNQRLQREDKKQREINEQWGAQLPLLEKNVQFNLLN